MNIDANILSKILVNWTQVYESNNTSWGKVRLVQHSEINRCNSLYQQVKAEDHIIITKDVEECMWQNLMSIHNKNPLANKD